MNCSSCGHRWCWVCGLPLDHWSHKFSDAMPLSCKMLPSSFFGWIFYSFLFLLGFIVLPLMILGFFALGTAYATVRCQTRMFSCLKRVSRCNRKGDCILFMCLVLPYLMIWGCIGLALGLAVAALGLALLTVPAYIFHTFYFVRTLYWWCKTSRTKD